MTDYTPDEDALDAAEARIQAARAIHTYDDERCTYCKHPDGTGEYRSPEWPCPTVHALDGDA